MTDAERIDMQRERAALAIKIRDLALRGDLASWGWIRSQLVWLASELESRNSEPAVSAREAVAT